MKFSDYDEGVQYAVDEPHVINESLTLYTTQCHFTTQLRVYDSNEHDGYFYSSILLGNIKSIAFNAGNNAGTVEVYGGVDGQDWALVESFQTKSAYADYEVNFANVTYNCFKVEVTGGKQVRFQSLVLTLDENKVASPTFIPSNGTTFTESLTVTASCATEGATIYYTTNGDIPTTGSYVFPENGLTINETTTIKAMAAMADGPLDPSTVVEATYTKGTQPEDTAFVAQYNGLYYAMATTENDDAMDALVVNVVNNKVVEMANRASISWYVNEGTGRITTAAGLYLTAATSGTALKLSDTATDEGIWTWDEANTAWTRLDKSTTRSFIYNESVNGFKNYAISNIGKDDYAVTYSIPMPIVNGYIREGLVANNYYGTICLPYAVEAEDFAGAEFFSIAGKKVGKDGQPTALVLKEVTELEAGVPYIFSATSEKLVAAYSGEAAETAGSANGLVGSFKGMNVTQGMYLINDENKVQQCGTGCSISTNRAYINMKLVSVYTEAAGANVRMLWFDGVETGIDGVTAEDGDQLVDVYTVGGVKVREQVRAAEATQGLQGGIYIVNRKKVAVK